MEEKKSIESLNDFIYDNDLSVDELEERLELDRPWFCFGYVCADCNSVCQPVCEPLA